MRVARTIIVAIVDDECQSTGRYNDHIRRLKQLLHPVKVQVKQFTIDQFQKLTIDQHNAERYRADFYLIDVFNENTPNYPGLFAAQILKRYFKGSMFIVLSSWTLKDTADFRATQEAGFFTTYAIDKSQPMQWFKDKSEEYKRTPEAFRYPEQFIPAEAAHLIRPYLFLAGFKPGYVHVLAMGSHPKRLLSAHQESRIDNTNEQRNTIVLAPAQVVEYYAQIPGDKDEVILGDIRDHQDTSVLLFARNGKIMSTINSVAAPLMAALCPNNGVVIEKSDPMFFGYHTVQVTLSGTKKELIIFGYAGTGHANYKALRTHNLEGLLPGPRLQGVPPFIIGKIDEPSRTNENQLAFKQLSENFPRSYMVHIEEQAVETAMELEKKGVRTSDELGYRKFKSCGSLAWWYCRYVNSHKTVHDTLGGGRQNR